MGIVTISGHSVREGSKRHAMLVAQAKHGADLSKSENTVPKNRGTSNGYMVSPKPIKVKEPAAPAAPSTAKGQMPTD